MLGRYVLIIVYDIVDAYRILQENVEKILKKANAEKKYLGRRMSTGNGRKGRTSKVMRREMLVGKRRKGGRSKEEKVESDERRDVSRKTSTGTNVEKNKKRLEKVTDDFIFQDSNDKVHHTS